MRFYLLKVGGGDGGGNDDGDDDDDNDGDYDDDDDDYYGVDDVNNINNVLATSISPIFHFNCANNDLSNLHYNVFRSECLIKSVSFPHIH